MPAAQKSPGRTLADIVMKRRWHFDSPDQARDSLAPKPPFNYLEPQCLTLYVQHGLKPVSTPGEAIRQLAALTIYLLS